MPGNPNRLFQNHSDPRRKQDGSSPVITVTPTESGNFQLGDPFKAGFEKIPTKVPSLNPLRLATPPMTSFINSYYIVAKHFDVSSCPARDMDGNIALCTGRFVTNRLVSADILGSKGTKTSQTSSASKLCPLQLRTNFSCRRYMSHRIQYEPSSDAKPQ
jgi:hypothetical protein